MEETGKENKSCGISELGDGAVLHTCISGRGKIVVIFEMSGCPFCQTFQPAFSEFVGRHARKFRIYRVLLDEYTNPLWNQYVIEAVPTIIVFSHGKIIARLDSMLGIGLSAGQLAEWLKTWIK